MSCLILINYNTNEVLDVSGFDRKNTTFSADDFDNLGAGWASHLFLLHVILQRVGFHLDRWLRLIIVINSLLLFCEIIISYLIDQWDKSVSISFSMDGSYRYKFLFQSVEPIYLEYESNKLLLLTTKLWPRVKS